MVTTLQDIVKISIETRIWSRICLRSTGKVASAVSALLAISLHVAADEIGTPTYSIVTGQNSELCQSYKAALEEESNRVFPYCDRTIVSPSPPFLPVERDYLDVAEIFEIYGRVQSFRFRSDQYYAERRKKNFMSSTREKSLKFLERQLATKQLAVWRYSPEPDIDNDGQPDRVLAWRYGRCRGPGASSPVFGTLLLVLTDDATHVDEVKTKEIFGHPEPSKSDYFQPVSSEMSVFQTNEGAFFDGWLDDSAPRAGVGGANIYVYKFHEGRRETVCELTGENM